MNRPPRHFFEFEDFRVEVEERRLLHKHNTITLTSKAFDILLALVQNSGQTVAKNDLMETVWEGTFVEEGNLNRHISTLRKILGDDPKSQRLIKTIPKRGYRFTAGVREIVEDDETLTIENVSRSRVVIREETTEGFWSRARVAVAASVLGAALLLGVFMIYSASTADTKAAFRHAAEDYVRRGRALWQTRKADDLHNATLLLEQARDADPSYATAHAALADAYAFDYANWRKAEGEALEAIRLDPNWGEPYATLGFVKTFWEWRVADAEPEFKKAITLAPGYATARQWYALNLAAAGRGDAALVEIQRAATLDPGSVPINIDHCRLLYFANQHRSAVEQCRKVLLIEAESRDARELLYRIYMTSNRHDEAVGMFVELAATSKDSGIQTWADRLRRAYADGGIQGFRRTQIDYFATAEPSAFYRHARVLAEMGDVDGAVRKLTEAIAGRDFEMVFFAPDPALEPVRTDPRRFELPGRPR